MRNQSPVLEAISDRAPFVPKSIKALGSRFYWGRWGVDALLRGAAVHPQSPSGDDCAAPENSRLVFFLPPRNPCPQQPQCLFPLPWPCCYKTASQDPTLPMCHLQRLHPTLQSTLLKQPQTRNRHPSAAPPTPNCTLCNKAGHSAACPPPPSLPSNFKTRFKYQSLPKS